MSDDTIELIRSVNPFPVELPAPAIEPLLARLDAEQTAAVRDRPRPGNGGVLLGVLATAVTVAVALAAIVLLGHGHPRQSTNRHPQPSAQARELTSILGVLRRPQTTADRDPALIRELRRGARDKYSLAIDGRPVLPLVRVATITPWGQRIYVVPFLAPTDQAKRRLPRRDQGAAVASTAALTTYPVTAGNGVPAEIEGGRDVGNGDYAHGEKPGSRWVMVVPDGVAKVALWPATGSIAQHPRHPTAPGSKTDHRGRPQQHRRLPRARISCTRPGDLVPIKRHHRQANRQCELVRTAARQLCLAAGWKFARCSTRRKSKSCASPTRTRRAGRALQQGAAACS